MGWTYTDLARNRITLQQAKEDHVRRATQYSRAGINATLLAQEWHPATWYAIIKLEYPADHEKHGKPDTFLRVDAIDTTNNSFGYKDMDEGMGPYVDNPPSASFKAKIFNLIPEATRYAADFRRSHGIRYNGDGLATTPKPKAASPTAPRQGGFGF
jgi:hypothetical protein